MRIKIATTICAAIIVLFTVVFAVVLRDCNQSEPAIEYGEFPFRFSYELDGQSHTIEDTVICTYVGLEGILHRRDWSTRLQSAVEPKAMLQQKDTHSAIHPERINTSAQVGLDYGYGGYYMGDPNADEMLNAEPHLYYHEVYKTDATTTYMESTMLSADEARALFGITVTEFDFSMPIKNTFESKKAN